MKTSCCRHLLLLLPLLLLLLTATLQVEAATSAEKQILLDFKSNITSDPTGALSSWTSSNDPCHNFAGVYCDPFGSVQRIVIHQAALHGVLSPSLSSLPSLQSLSLFGNSLTGQIPASYASLSLTLHKLNLSTNALSGEVPSFLGQFISLRLLDLSYNSFTGQIPEELFQNCVKTRYVSLSHNLLTGPVPHSIGNCTNLAGFDFSFNNLTGQFPPQICEPPAINYVSLRSNSLSGTVADKISNCASLDLFDIGSNLFSGFVPFNLVSLVNITYFNVSWNKFDGQIPEISSCGNRLGYFDVSGNTLAGAIPAGIANCGALRFFDLGSNNLSGTIPNTIGGLKSLSVLRLSENAEITGQIPAELGGIDLLQVLDLGNLDLSGDIPGTISQCRFLLELDLSGNQLQGEIPSSLYNMTYLKILDLHSNQLNGSIPPTIGNLTNLEALDLSYNSLGGPIPPSLSSLKNVTYFNVSYNNLSGEIPHPGILQSFSASAFMQNPLLCGAPLNNNCLGRRARRLSVSVIIVIIAVALILVGVCIVCAMNISAYKKRGGGKVLQGKVEEGEEEEEEEIIASESTQPPPSVPASGVIIGKLVLFSKSLPSRYEDWEAGTRALLDKDCVIGFGSIGTVYKASFESGISIAVKKLDTLGQIRTQDEFEQEMGRLGGLSHPNLVSFQGYYWSSNMHLILSEFVQNESLYDHLHGTLYSAVGYVAPELASQSLRFSDKCDVYSFGVILLEIVTGRKPVDSPGTAKVVVLRDYVREVLEEGVASNCFDRRLRGFVEAELIQVLKLGLVCTSEVPARRPSMAEVVQFLESIRTNS
ncbi:putative LRR receptor-like serine/threonine-protein kinase [Carex littledalei]|uniref:Putative LRR receptor-like serine/threonine-protein kinase n=1 Tax=Carex littledalei TaxID=544730 RepID=A0A833Q8P1_9POAL|nr:putative LRR receptor-like serine/threonine-protein kinase [Carex littledalei]